MRRKEVFDSNRFNPDLSEDVAIAMSLTPNNQTNFGSVNPNYNNFRQKCFRFTC